MPLTGNPSHDIPVELAAGKPRKQAIAIAMNEKREHGHDAKGDACPKCEGSGKLKNGDRCLRCMGTGVQGAADAKGDGMNAHLDPGSREDGPSTGTLMDILRGDSERRAKTMDMLIEVSHTLTKRAASLFDKKGS